MTTEMGLFCHWRKRVPGILLTRRLVYGGGGGDRAGCTVGPKIGGNVPGIACGSAFGLSRVGGGGWRKSGTVLSERMSGWNTELGMFGGWSLL